MSGPLKGRLSGRGPGWTLVGGGHVSGANRCWTREAGPGPQAGRVSAVGPGTAASSASLVRSILDQRAFRPVFQPIFELESQSIVAYEALTRFDSGRPDLIFAAARSAGLHAELEAATLTEALRAAGSLPAAARLHLNVSADLILANEPLAGLLRAGGWLVVLELTGDVEVTDYAAFRTALARLGPDVMLAVDDAGAGFASLRHLVELVPAFVKLDRSLTNGIKQSTAKQALVAGLSYFTLRTGTILIAEGIEDAAVIRTLVNLGVTLGQGYYLARPMEPEMLRRPPPVPRGWAEGAASGRPAPLMDPDMPIEQVVNIGARLGTALRELGIRTFGDLVDGGALGTWRRIRDVHPQLATPATLVSLEASIARVRPSMLPAKERAALSIIASVERGAPGASG